MSTGSGPRAVPDLADDEIAALVMRLGGKPFQARQAARWVYVNGAASWAECHNLPRDLRARLADELSPLGSNVRAVTRATDETAKLLIGLRDGDAIETVVIPDGNRTTVCISSQVGCPVGCVFCASGLAGVRRNLTRGEIIEQVLHARAYLRAHEPTRRITNVVVMGLGEPMLNLDHLTAALARITDEDGIGLGARRITVSTSGYPDRIERFAAEPAAYGLAVSLHAADDELRRRLVPTARASVADLVAAARRYFERKRREVTFEVVLLAGVNDRAADADGFARVLRGWPCTVNLIPWNPVPAIAAETSLRRPPPERVAAFAERLREAGLNVTTRRQRGADRDAACGQLRLRVLEAGPT